ncbi:hypothetical protein [Clavibacter zhangzhiyongii]|uniref:hypothetical protein n=1 Tax=Clavibacter zhangzhiyongii TaxID=2768071 RepID=UPI0039DFDD43
MSIHPRSTRLFSARNSISALALTAIVAIGISVAVPQSAAFAATDSARSRIERSASHDTLAEDVRTGKVTAADVDAVSRTGFDYRGQHIPAWAGDLEADEASARTAPPVVAPGSAARTAPSLAAGEVQAAPGAAPASASGSGIAESKSIWSRIRDVAEWLGKDHWFYVNGKWVQWMAGASLGAVVSSFCSAIGRSLPTLAMCSLGAVLAWATMGLLHQTLCGQRGMWVDLPFVRKSHCNSDRQ